MIGKETIAAWTCWKEKRAKYRGGRECQETGGLFGTELGILGLNAAPTGDGRLPDRAEGM